MRAKITQIQNEGEVFSNWRVVQVKGGVKPLIISENWFGQRRENGFELPKVGTEIEYEEAQATYSNATDYQFIKGLRIIE